MRFMLLIIIALLISARCSATDSVPVWVLSGIMAQETRSYYAIDGDTIVYVDKRVGQAGELSAFQIKRIAWQQVAGPGEQFSRLATDQAYAQLIAIKYLIWLYDHSAKRSWPHAIQYYNRGPGRPSYRYYANVVAKAKRAGYVP